MRPSFFFPFQSSPKYSLNSTSFSFASAKKQKQRPCLTGTETRRRKSRSRRWPMRERRSALRTVSKCSFFSTISFFFRPPLPFPLFFSHLPLTSPSFPTSRPREPPRRQKRLYGLVFVVPVLRLVSPAPSSLQRHLPGCADAAGRRRAADPRLPRARREALAQRRVLRHDDHRGRVPRSDDGGAERQLHR